MADTIRIPVKKVGKDLWGDLGAIAVTHDICGETVKLKDMQYSFAAGHRVRLYHFKKNVHFRLPAGLLLDITEVTPAVAPRRRGHG